MMGRAACMVFRAPIARRRPILLDLARTSLTCRVFNARSVVGHGGRKRGSTDRKRRCGKCDRCLAKHDRPPRHPAARTRGALIVSPTKTSQPFLSQSILSQPILSQSRGAPQAGGGDHRWLADTAGSGAGEPERKRTTEARRWGSSTCNIWWSLEGAKVRLSEEDLRALHQLPRVNGAPANGAYIYPGKRHRTCLEMILPQLRLVAPLAKCRCDTFRAQ